MNQQQKTLLSIVLVIAVLGGGIAYYNHESNERSMSNEYTTEIINDDMVEDMNGKGGDMGNMGSTSQSVSATTTGVVSSTTKPSSNRVVKVSTTYNVPDNFKNTINLSVTLNGGVITDITHSENPAEEISKKMYDNFSKSLDKSGLIGKKINEVSLSKVGGASLTTKAFMEALGKASQM